MRQAELDAIVATFRERQLDALEIFEKKFRSRGPENITAQGVGGVILRMQHDKMARLKKVARAALLKQSDADFDSETYLAENGVQLIDVIDDLTDISNYAIMSIMLLTGEWGGEE